MQDNTVLLPSPNSAFTWTGGKRCSDRVCPSHTLRKQLLFGGERFDGNDVAAEVEEVMRYHQSSFMEKWKCRCDVIVRCCDGSQSNSTKKPKIPKYDWSPIDKPIAYEDEPVFDKFLGSDDSSDAGSRPGSPIPFSPTHLCHHYCSTSCSETSSCQSRILTSSEPPEGCLTPPSSPNSPLTTLSDVFVSSNRNDTNTFEVGAQSDKESGRSTPCETIIKNLRSKKEKPHRS